MEYGSSQFGDVGFAADVNEQVLPPNALNNFEIVGTIATSPTADPGYANTGIISIGDR